MARTKDELAASSKELDSARDELAGVKKRADALAQELQDAQGAAASTGKALQADLEAEHAARADADTRAQALQDRLNQLEVILCPGI